MKIIFKTLIIVSLPFLLISILVLKYLDPPIEFVTIKDPEEMA